MLLFKADEPLEPYVVNGKRFAEELQVDCASEGRRFEEGKMLGVWRIAFEVWRGGVGYSKISHWVWCCFLLVLRGWMGYSEFETLVFSSVFVIYFWAGWVGWGLEFGVGG